MMARRVCSALALCCFAACSFPDYQVVNASSHCSDGKANGDETGVDCGGSCEACPTCDDPKPNGNESDTDCNEDCSPHCLTGEPCRRDADCASLVCVDRSCRPPSCSDQVRNGYETGVDCGGACKACDSGGACKLDADCDSLHCEMEVCVDADCKDHISNGQETDVDCGGEDCPPCDPSSRCNEDGDCKSHLCSTGHICIEETCSDGIRNQGESDTDCGGPNCSGCGAGKTCNTASDCAENICRSSLCIPTKPTGDPLSRAGWHMSSSESTTESGLTRPFDGDESTCWSSGKAQYAGMYVEVDLGEPRIFFTALLQTTKPPCDQDFPSRFEVYVSNDGDFGDPVVTEMGGDQYTWIHFPSVQVARYIRFVLTAPSPRPWGIGELKLLE